MVKDRLIYFVGYKPQFKQNILAVFKKTISSVRKNDDIFWQVWIQRKKASNDPRAFSAIGPLLPLALSNIYHTSSIHCKFSQYHLQPIHRSCASRGRMAIQTEKLVIRKEHTGSTINTIGPNARNDAVGEKRYGGLRRPELSPPS